MKSAKSNRNTLHELLKGAVLASTWLLLALSAASAKAPNIVFILADDLGYGDVACFGGKRCKIDTPNLDALAQGGVKFTNAYVNASVCGPTRAAIMTGRYPWRLGGSQPGGPWGFVGPRFSTDTFTLADLLRRAGYRSGYVGKWHLGTRMTTKDGQVQNEHNVDYGKPLIIGPKEYGWQHSFILPGSLDMFPYAFAKNNIWQGKITAQKGWSAFNRVGDAEENFRDDRVLETFYREADTFLENQSADQPFFLYLALTAPHTPISPSPSFQKRSKLGVYGDFVMEVDHSVQRIRQTLDRQGLSENTLIIFSSDHGPASYAGNILKATPGQIHDLEAIGHYPAGPFRGYKFSVYEGGLRVPFVAYWPNEIKPGGTSRALIGLCDLMATVAELCDVDLADEEAPDSISFAHSLRNPQAAGQRKNLVMQSIGPFVVREGPWKLCLCPGSGATGKYGNAPASEIAWKNALKNGPQILGRQSLRQAPFVQLFNVEMDPHEDKNLAANEPGKVTHLLSVLERQINQGRSTPGPKLNNDTKQIPLFQRLPKFIRSRLP